MKVNITDAIYVHGKSGVGLRFSLTISARHPDFGIIAQTTKGCLAFRNRKGKINVMAPLMYLGPAKVRYRPITFSPGAADYIQQELETSHGEWMTRKEVIVATGIPAAEKGAPSEINLSFTPVADGEDDL